MTKQKKFLSIGTNVANCVLAGTGILCVLALSYVYTDRWIAQKQFTSWTGVLLYYVSPALLAILLFSSLRLRKTLRINLALAIFSMGVSIYMLEILLTVWSSLPSVMYEVEQKKRAAAAKALGIEFDTRSKRQVVDELRAQGIDAVLAISPLLLLRRQNDGTVRSVISIHGSEILPLAGIANKRVVVCNEGGQFLTYTSDQYGFNNPPEVWRKGPIDIVAVGDSFVQGICVSSDDSFVAIIRNRHVGTLGLGMAGNGPLSALAVIKEYTHIVLPKIVLWFYYEGNDMSDLHRETSSALLRRYLSDGFSQGLVARQKEIDRALHEYIKTARDDNKLLASVKEISEHIYELQGKKRNILTLSQLRHRLGLVQGGVAYPSRSAAPRSTSNKYGEIELLGKILAEAKEFIGQWKGSLYFVYLPAYSRYTSEHGRFHRDQVLRVANNAGLPVIDIHQTFAAQKDPLALFPLRRPGHYNRAGNRLVAEEVLRSVSYAK